MTELEEKKIVKEFLAANPQLLEHYELLNEDGSNQLESIEIYIAQEIAGSLVRINNEYFDPSHYISEDLNIDQVNYLRYNSPKIIVVQHNIYYDIRIIPKTFLEYKVESRPTQYQYECKYGTSPYIREGILNYHFLSEHEPERYFLFVKENLDMMRKKLKNPQLSQMEALNMLTYDFEKYVNEHKEKMNKKYDTLLTGEYENVVWESKKSFEDLKKHVNKLESKLEELKEKKTEEIIPSMLESLCEGDYETAIEISNETKEEQKDLNDVIRHHNLLLEDLGANQTIIEDEEINENLPNKHWLFSNLTDIEFEKLIEESLDEEKTVIFCMRGKAPKQYDPIFKIKFNYELEVYRSE